MPTAPDFSALLGGRLGVRTARRGMWFDPAPIVFFAGTLAFLVLMLRQIPCNTGADVYAAGCYTDIRPLFYWRGLSQGAIPFIGADVEYPVLIGALMAIALKVTTALGGQVGPDLPDDVISHAADIFCGFTALMMFGFFLVLLWAHLRLKRPWDALMIAVSPAVITCGYINWDLMVVAFTSLAVLSWSRKRPRWAGIWIGLGIAAKLYPLLLLVPLAVLCLRARRLRPFFLTVATTALAWVAVNLPVYLITPSGWLYFWTFNVNRGAELGSIWYVLQLAGHPVEHLSTVVSILTAAGTLVVMALLVLAPRRPRLSQGFFLVLVVFLVFNKVYSPQYVLWLLPVLILARPKWLDWVVFGAAETLYFAAVWAHIDGALAPGSGGSERLYWASVLLRIAVQLWISLRVLWDMFQPAHDPLRSRGLDDPHGGVLDGAPDAAWVGALPWRR